MHVVCFIDDVFINNLSYANDIVLLSSSIGGLKKILKVCKSYALVHGLRYNDKKSEYRLFKANSKYRYKIPPLILGGVLGGKRIKACTII